MGERQRLFATVLWLHLLLGEAAVVPAQKLETAAPSPPRPVGLAPNHDDVIDESNLAFFEPVPTPSLAWIVRHGAKLKVGKYQKTGLAKPLSEATKQYSGEVELNAADQLQDYVAGLPFASVDTSDPRAATKLMWNTEAAGAVDDLEIELIECDARTIGPAADRVRADRHFIFDNFRRLYFTGRLYVDPKPTIDPNRDLARYKEALYPVIEPFDLRGNGLFTIRYISRKPPWSSLSPFDTWLYMPNIRRVRRLSQAMRSQAMFGQDIDPDSFGGFAGAVPSFEWNLLGETTRPSPFHGDRMPVRWSQAPASYLPDVAWEPRTAWVVEGKPTMSGEYSFDKTLYEFSRRVLYVDRETYRVLASDLYDRDGQLSKIWVASFFFGGVRDGGSLVPSVTMIDPQNARVTYCSLPGENGGISLNTGTSDAVREEVYDLPNSLGLGR